MASHLLFTEWISSHAGPTPDLIKDGYPLGPHAIVAATAKVSGASLIEGFAGLTGAIAVLLALTAYGALGGIRGWLRVPAAVLAASSVPGRGLPGTGRLQGADARPGRARLRAGAAGRAPGLVQLSESDPHQSDSEGTRPGRGPRSRSGVIAAGTIYNYSFPGLAWLLGAAMIWMLVIAMRERDRDAIPHCRPSARASGFAEPEAPLRSGSGSPSWRRCRRSSGWRASRASRPSTRPAPARRSASATSASRSTRWRRSGSGPRGSSGSPRRTRPPLRSPSISEPCWRSSPSRGASAVPSRAGSRHCPPRCSPRRSSISARWPWAPPTRRRRRWRSRPR